MEKTTIDPKSFPTLQLTPNNYVVWVKQASEYLHLCQLGYLISEKHDDIVVKKPLNVRLQKDQTYALLQRMMTPEVKSLFGDVVDEKMDSMTPGSCGSF